MVCLTNLDASDRPLDNEPPDSADPEVCRQHHAAARSRPLLTQVALLRIELQRLEDSIGIIDRTAAQPERLKIYGSLKARKARYEARIAELEDG
jgi:hypothetical protein